MFTETAYDVSSVNHLVPQLGSQPLILGREYNADLVARLRLASRLFGDKRFCARNQLRGVRCDVQR